MAGRGQTIATHTSIVFFLVSGLSGRCQTYDHVSSLDILIVDYVRTFHAASDRTIYDDGTN